MKELTIEEYKHYILDILKDVDKYCASNDLSYYLDSGTLLGAVRHKGFIPWDDDIDLIMPRNDYEIFINQFYSSKCEVLTMYNTKDYYYQFAKVSMKNTKVVENRVPEIKSLGINIDVFPIDGMPNTLVLRRIHQDILFFYSKFRTLLVLLSKKNNKNKIYSKIWRLVLWRIDHLGNKYSFDQSRFVGNITATSVRHKETRSDCFENTERLWFENAFYPVPEGYDEYLTDLFGNYMALPPLNQRVPKHNFTAYIY